MSLWEGVITTDYEDDGRDGHADGWRKMAGMAMRRLLDGPRRGELRRMMARMAWRMLLTGPLGGDDK